MTGKKVSLSPPGGGLYITVEVEMKGVLEKLGQKVCAQAPRSSTQARQGRQALVVQSISPPPPT